MGQHVRRDSYPSATSSRLEHLHHQGSRRLDLLVLEADDLAWPFEKIVSFEDYEVRETAYEIFFTSCRSSPGFGGRHALTFHLNHESNGGNGDGGKLNQVVTKPTSRVKKALGLKLLKRSPSKRMLSGILSSGVASTPSSPLAGAGNPFSHTLPPFRPRRPMTAAEIMRQQMRVTEHNDNKLRKTLMRTLVGQMGKRSETNQTIIIPLELLRHLKPAEFSDSQEYHMWQKRQLKVLEAGLLLYPSIPLENNNSFATRLRDLVSNAESKPIDTGKNSDTMRTLCNSVVSLSWRSSNGTPTDVCHWADGFPFNMHLYTFLLQSIFDIRDDTLVLDEVDELFELMQKTWSTLGITLPIHNVCFTWVLFHQYIVTGQVEPDLLCASHAMLNEVANDAKKEKDSLYIKILSSVLSSMQGWAEKRLLNYHEYFQRGNANQIENLLPLVLTTSKILGEDLTITDGEGGEKGDITIVDSSGDRVDNYIRSSMKNAFEKVVEAVNAKSSEYERRELGEVLIQLAQETEDLVMKERQHFSPIIKKWHSSGGAVAAVMLHRCYGQVLRQYISEVTSLTSESVQVLQRAGKLEKFMVQIVVEDSSECDDGGKTVVREMLPFDVDSVILSLLVKWIDESLSKVKECVQRAKETETWNPKSKSEQFAPSAAELMKLAATTVEECFQVPIPITEDLVQVLADGLEILFQGYIMFVAACGSKQSYVPVLPSLTRCNPDSKFIKLWKKAAPCSSGCEEQHCTKVIHEGHHHHHKQSTSRGTQRLYIRLNTLHYLLTHIQSLDKALFLNPGVVPSNRIRFTKNRRDQSSASSYFESANLCILAACQHVSEVAAYRLVFHDSRSVFYDSLYVGGVARGHIKPVLRILNHNISLLTTILTEKAQSLALKEVMKATFNSFLMVLLAGGSSRLFVRPDHEIIREDFEHLRRIFSNCVEGLIADNVVEGEAALAEGVIALMSQSTEQLMEDFSIVTCEGSGTSILGNSQNLPMPPTTGKWNKSDPNTILRVLCYRNDRAANQFLKRTFQLAKRR
ncbi:hypothetical protein Lal_00022264 [Lupinus albus]|uniref:Uncharacterized protein n=1 Tax=Lupinus albus TaxID=3870 RepID=A0A6A5NDS0_LUPAL|nr:hypothetical protein Lalb_Chr06g0169431 [Lupinus albus]KAF1880135.1 hypothetical protein Lal_00022264 [Lupinus albus]